MVQAYRVAVEVGLSPVEFWQLTPYLTRHAVESVGERIKSDWLETQWLAWNTAALTRAKKMPKFDKFTGRKQSGMSAAEVQAGFEALERWQKR